MVTFLFTDIEGSTQRWDEYPDAMDTAIKRHDAVMRTAIAQHNGHVFKTVGDAFCAAFGRVEDAVQAAIDAQRALADVDFTTVDGLRVRMALHVGRASERDGDFFGPILNRVARLMSVAHGGQVLLSDAVHESLCGALPAVACIDLGLRRLRDLTQPERVWQLSAAGLEATFPPLDSLDARPNNLPFQATALIGREQDLADVKRLVEGHRLVTISGAGGIGKTRIALQAAADLIDRYAHGAWLADLAPIQDRELVCGVVAKVLNIRVPEGQRVEEAIPRQLQNKKLLLVLDNCEHMLSPVAELADAILATAPGVKLLANSRQALNISGEVVFRLPSLAVPEDTQQVDVQTARQFGAVALFAARAEAADSHFELTGENVCSVAEICRHLDGIPLAIELAASRVKVLSIPTLARHLDDRFKILTGGSRTALPRQKTLTALIDWSYELLTPREQTMFSGAAIFAGGFGLEAAIEVCGAELDEADVLDHLTSLVDKSLVLAETGGQRERYRLLESNRAYALEKLSAAGLRERLARRHAEYFCTAAQMANTGSEGIVDEWLILVELDLDNYRAALKWALDEANDAKLGAIVAGSLRPLWAASALATEGCYWIERSQARLDESVEPQLAAKLWLALAQLCLDRRRYDCSQRALALYESLGDSRGVANALSGIGYGLVRMGRLDEAGDAFARLLEARTRVGDKRGIANCLGRQAIVYQLRGDIAAARDANERALEAHTALNDTSGVAVDKTNLAELEFAEGNAARALALASEALLIYERRKDLRSLAYCRVNSVAYRIALGNLDAARDSATEGLRWARQAQEVLLAAVALQHLGLIGALRGKLQGPAGLIGYLNAQYEQIGIKRAPAEQQSYDKLMMALREQLPDADLQRFISEGATWSQDRAVETAMEV